MARSCAKAAAGAAAPDAQGGPLRVVGGRRGVRERRPEGGSHVARPLLVPEGDLRVL